MVSLTGKTERRRLARHRSMAPKKAKLRMRTLSPKFPIQPEGYDPKAPDAKKPAETGSQSK